MRWPDGNLVLGVFQERLHRFGATVTVKGRQEYCHVTNSGRLRELLIPGATVALVDHGRPSQKPFRKTRYAVRLSKYRKKWVCIEANMAPRLLWEGWKKGLVPPLTDYDELKAEVPLDAHTRFDFRGHNSKTGETTWIEVKCVTLVKDGRAFFPDSPSTRASKHLMELMKLSLRPRTKCFVFFILQNPYGLSISPKDDTDPLFGQTLRKTARSKVIVKAFQTQIDLRGAKLMEEIPVLL